MSLAALIRRMAEAGAPPEAIALAVEAIEAEQAKAAEKRAQAAFRKAEQRERERLSRDCPATVTGQGEDTDETKGRDKSFPDTPSKTQPKQAPLNPPGNGKKRGAPIPAEWAPPPVAELSPKAKECAEKWPASRYETEAEGFVAFWLNDGRSRPDWRLTWITWVIRVHSQVMRDARFAPPATVRSTSPMNVEQLRAAIRFAEDNDDRERADELKRQLAELKQRPPDPKVAAIISQTARKLVSHPTGAQHG